MLKSTLKFLIKDTAFYGVGNAVSKSLQLITLPLVVKSVSDPDFSNWNMIQASTAILAGLVLFGMDSAAARFFYDVKDTDNRKKIFTNALFVQIILSFILLPLFIVSMHTLEKYSGTDAAYHNDFILTLFWIPASALTSYFTSWFKWTFQKRKFVVLTFGLAALNLLLLLYLKLSGTLNIHLIVQINLFVQWGMVLYCLAVSGKYFTAKISVALIKKLSAFGVPFMIVFVLGIVRMSLDRYFLRQYINDNDFAMYSFCQKLSIIILLAVTAFDFAFNPMVYTMWDKPEAKRVFSKIQSLYIIGMVGISLAIMSCSIPLIIIMGKQSYVAAAYFLPFMLFANFGYGLISFSLIGINYSKKTYLLVILIAIALAAMALFNFIFIKMFTVYAAAASQLIANLVLVGLGYILSARYYHVTYNFIKDILVFVLGLLLSFPFGFIKLGANVYLDAAIKLIICTVLFISLIRLFFNAELKAVMNRYWKNNNS
ncbi:MAG: polysaccharide biosynthesis protein [Chitinophagaceae bacterium]|nr:polysaccharide biosynthesis protein [Chitinophagaceae bacterium]MDB5222745.1 polysaccharide biosynthesis protein [Chitinophagaceae bacterium]